LAWSFQPTETAPHAARRLIRELDPPLPDDAREKVELLVSELVSKAVQHGPHGQDSRIRLTVERFATGLRAEVVDEGGGFSNLMRSPTGTDHRGWGLSIVEGLSSAWGIVDGDHGTKVWAELSMASP
jgi:serine/threonine-protein kinase RsbW